MRHSVTLVELSSTHYSSGEDVSESHADNSNPNDTTISNLFMVLSP